jgi:hypothetical protein
MWNIQREQTPIEKPKKLKLPTDVAAAMLGHAEQLARARADASAVLAPNCPLLTDVMRAEVFLRDLAGRAVGGK